MLNFGFKRSSKGLPSLDRLFYARTPNGTGGNAGKYMADPYHAALIGSATWSAAPTVGADGVVAGNGPTLEADDTIDWTSGGTLTVVFKATSANSAISGDVQVFGPVYANSSGLLAKDGTNTATYATTWANGDIVTAVVEVETDGTRNFMRVGRVS